MYRRKRRTAKVNTKLMVDVVLASLIVQKAPALISGFVTLDPMIAKVAGIGAGYVTGVVAKRPDISNAAIALGLIDFINPFVDQIIGTGAQLPEFTTAQQLVTTNGNGVQGQGRPDMQSVSDFISLNDYTNNPTSRQAYRVYQDSY